MLERLNNTDWCVQVLESTCNLSPNYIPYSRDIRLMRLYLHMKRICAYKRAAPNKEQRLNSSTSMCEVHAYSAP